MASTSGKSGERPAEESLEILLLEEKIFDAIKGRDASVLEGFLTEDFVYRSPGQEVGRDDFLKLCATFPYEIISIRGEELKVNIYENLAVVTGLQFAKAKMEDGNEEASVVAFTDVFVKQNGNWTLSLAHAIDIPQSADQEP